MASEKPNCARQIKSECFREPETSHPHDRDTGGSQPLRNNVERHTIANSIVSAENDPLIKWDRLRQLCIDIARLRRGDLHQERICLDRDWLALEQSNTAHQREIDFWKWTERPDIHQKLFPDREGGLSLETLEKIEKELKLM